VLSRKRKDQREAPDPLSFLMDRAGASVALTAQLEAKPLCTVVRTGNQKEGAPYSPSILRLWASNTNDSRPCTNS
jgi:hypothetical protein